MKICDEMVKLRAELDKKGIQWKDASSIRTEAGINAMIDVGIKAEYADTSMYRTHFEHNGYKFRVIHGFGSYGGKDTLTGNDRGLLECMTEKINGGEPVGFLTAAEVLNIEVLNIIEQEG